MGIRFNGRGNRRGDGWIILRLGVYGLNNTPTVSTFTLSLDMGAVSIDHSL